MRSTKLGTRLLGMALAAVIAAPVAYAMPADPVGSTTATHEASDVPPPPSSIAASAGEEYEALRAPDESTAAVDAPAVAGGFDWASAAIGAVAAAALSLVSLAAIATRRRSAIG